MGGWTVATRRKGGCPQIHRRHPVACDDEGCQAVELVGRRSPWSPAELDELRQRCGFSRRKVAAFLGVDKRTYQRWQHRGAPWWAGALLRYQAGLPPWQGWEGWRFADGAIWPPGYRYAVTPGQVLAVPYRLQLIAELKRQIRQFWEMDDQADASASHEGLRR